MWKNLLLSILPVKHQLRETQLVLISSSRSLSKGDHMGITQMVVTPVLQLTDADVAFLVKAFAAQEKDALLQDLKVKA